jgi:D-alanine-D-alanine ligase
LPALVKPNHGDSSVGITMDAVVRTSEELVAYLKAVREMQPGSAVLIQEYLSGSEFSVGVLGNPSFGYRLLPVLEVDYGNLPADLPPILGYESKWLPESPYWNAIQYKESVLDEDTKRRLYDYSTQLFEHLGCRDYARFDFRADAAGEIKLLEVNPNPGWCWDGKLSLMAEFAGMRYAELLAEIIQRAQDRVRSRTSI